MAKPVSILQISPGAINKLAAYESFRSALDLQNMGTGALVEFTGIARADLVGDKLTTALDIEHYPGMTEKAMQSIINSAIKRWELDGVLLVHRVGKIMVGEDIVYLASASTHRGSAFEATQYIMDFLKNDVPLWKKASTEAGELWIAQKDSDRVRKKSWE